MVKWTPIKSDRDISSLLAATFGFHDSHLINLFYRSGDQRVDKGIAFGAQEEHLLFIQFASNWYPQTLELCFSGVRKYQIAGFQKYYSSEISDCYLKFHHDIYRFSSERLIVWADSCGFNPQSENQNDLMHEPMISYIVADQLKWRFVDSDTDQN